MGCRCPLRLRRQVESFVARSFKSCLLCLQELRAWLYPNSPLLNESEAELLAATANFLEGGKNTDTGSFD